MRIRPPSPIVVAGEGHAIPTLGRAWLAALLVAALAGRADAQSGPIIPDPDPTVGLRVEGPLLSARPPGQVAAPPTNDPGPFQAVVPGSGRAVLGDAAGDGPE